jgi:hypothetical protein
MHRLALRAMRRARHKSAGGLDRLCHQDNDLRLERHLEPQVGGLLERPSATEVGQLLEVPAAQSWLDLAAATRPA